MFLIFLKVLNPLFLDDLRESLQEAGDNPRKLLNLRRRISKIRVFDPACGSGNFLVIAYKEMRQIESEINKRRHETHLRSEIPLSNFRGIELREFATEIARLALIIAEYQCDELYRGQKDALADFLPLDSKNWIVHGNALRIDWLSVCPPTEKAVEHIADDLFHKPQSQEQIDFENEGGETYICGNPPYIGSTWQSKEQKSDIGSVFANHTSTWKALDYVSGWLMKAALYGVKSNCDSAFVMTNSICQGQQVPFLWPLIFGLGYEISFAHTSFKWANLAEHNAQVVVVIVGISINKIKEKKIYSIQDKKDTVLRTVKNINAYLLASPNIIVNKSMKPLSRVGSMDFGNKADDGGHLTLNQGQLETMDFSSTVKEKFIKRFWGSKEFINGIVRYCIWIEDNDLEKAKTIDSIANQIDLVRQARLASKDAYANSLAKRSHQFKTPRVAKKNLIITPRVSSENRPYLPVGYLDNSSVIGDRNFALYDVPLWNMALIASKLHWVWVGTVCVRLGESFSYSNTLGWNTFPVPPLTEKNKLDLTRCAEDILLAREKHFPATIADLYKSDAMPENLGKRMKRMTKP